MIHNIVFDISGVLADYRIMEFLAEKGFDRTLIKRIIKASALSPFWGQYERGEITEEEAIRGFASLDPEIEKELRIAYSSVAGLLTIRDYAIPLVQDLKKAGCHVYYLSNYSQKAYDECGGSLAFMPYMDGGLVSFKVGMTKPDPAMYQRLLDEYGMKAEESIFVDDAVENVEAAKQIGFEGIVFTSYDDLISELQRFGVGLRKSIS